MTLVPLIIFYVLAVVLCIFVVRMVLWLYSSALVFSRLAFALLFGLLLTQNCPTLVDNGFINFAIYAAISLVAIFALSMLPRADCAIRFFCSIAISILLTTMLATIVLAIFSWSSDEYISNIPLSYEIGLKIICTIFSLGTLIEEMSTVGEKLLAPTHPVVENMDRVLASMFYGMAAISALASWGGNWNWPQFVYYGIGIVVAVLAFLADNFFLKNAVKDIQEDI